MLKFTFTERKQFIVVTADRYRIYYSFCCAIVEFNISPVNFKLGFADIMVVVSPS